MNRLLFLLPKILRALPFFFFFFYFYLARTLVLPYLNSNLLPPPLDRINSCCAACRILVPCPGFKPVPPAVEAQSPNHWTAREAPTVAFLQVSDLALFPQEPPRPSFSLALIMALVVPVTVRLGCLPRFLTVQCLDT